MHRRHYQDKEGRGTQAKRKSQTDVHIHSQSPPENTIKRCITPSAYPQRKHKRQ